MMQILFIHQNFPAQFKHLASYLSMQHQVIALLDEANSKKHYLLENVIYYTYPTPEPASITTHHYIQNLEACVRRGQAVIKCCHELKIKRKLEPDVIYVHPGWGEALYLKNIFPRAVIIGFFEFYYHESGRDVGFDPEFPVTIDTQLKVRTKNSNNLLSLQVCDVGISPTRWQHTSYPSEYHKKIKIIFDGIDTSLVLPNPDARVTLADTGEILDRTCKVVTFVNRNLEPYRGYHSFMRSIPGILKSHPDAFILIVGDDGVSYGSQLEKGETYKDKYLKEVAPQLNLAQLEQIKFLGRISYSAFLQILQISSVHVYLTYPFVLSWSMLEAMSCGCIVVGSATPPVEEVIVHKKNGLLVDFFNYEQIADTVNNVLLNTQRYDYMRRSARQTIIQKYDLRTVCLPRHIKLLNKWTRKRNG